MADVELMCFFLCTALLHALDAAIQRLQKLCIFFRLAEGLDKGLCQPDVRDGVPRAFPNSAFVKGSCSKGCCVPATPALARRSV